MWAPFLKAVDRKSVCLLLGVGAGTLSLVAIGCVLEKKKSREEMFRQTLLGLSQEKRELVARMQSRQITLDHVFKARVRSQKRSFSQFKAFLKKGAAQHALHALRLELLTAPGKGSSPQKKAVQPPPLPPTLVLTFEAPTEACASAFVQEIWQSWRLDITPLLLCFRAKLTPPAGVSGRFVMGWRPFHTAFPPLLTEGPPKLLKPSFPQKHSLSKSPKKRLGKERRSPTPESPSENGF